MVFECHSRMRDCFLKEVADMPLVVSSSWFPVSSFIMALKNPILTLDEAPLVQIFYCLCTIRSGSPEHFGKDEPSVDFSGATDITKVNYMWK